MIPITKPFLPPIEEYYTQLEGIWNRNWLTNNGPLVSSLEKEILKESGAENCLFVSNGTIAIQIAIKALGLKGEIITTPFSYVATTSSISWESCIPIFADIDPQTLNIDPEKIEDKITSNTSAILATHVFGNICEVDKIQEIANKHNLKIIYDAAHAFGVKYQNKSIMDYGDISTTSFHSTKLFHTVEGGGIFSKSELLISKMSKMRNFGHNGEFTYDGIGINGKNSEFHAAMGLINLKFLQDILYQRKELSNYYDGELNLEKLSKPSLNLKFDYNFAYYPIIFKSESTLERVLKALNSSDIFPRRYFYPSLSKLNYTGNQKTPVSDSVSKKILCLPLYHDLAKSSIKKIAQILNKEL